MISVNVFGAFRRLTCRQDSVINFCVMSITTDGPHTGCSRCRTWPLGATCFSLSPPAPATAPGSAWWFSSLPPLTWILYVSLSSLYLPLLPPDCQPMGAGAWPKPFIPIVCRTGRNSITACLHMESRNSASTCRCHKTANSLVATTGSYVITLKGGITP